MDTGLYGGTRGDGPKLHFGFGERQEGNLHSQSAIARHYIRREHLETYDALVKAIDNLMGQDNRS
jgi:hypothetical protein